MTKEFVYEYDFHLCLRCGKQFKHRGLLNRHLKNKTPCDINYIKCSRSELIKDYYILFYNNLEIIKSKIIKTMKLSSINQFKCNYCNKVTKTTRGLEQHIQKYCLKNKKLEYRYDKVINSAKNLLEDYAIFMKHYDNIKTGTNAVYHPSVVELVVRANIFKVLDKIVNNSVDGKDISKPKNFYGKIPKLRLKNNNNSEEIDE